MKLAASITNESTDELKLEKGQNGLRHHQGDECDGGRGLVDLSNVRTCRNGGFLSHPRAEKTKTIRQLR